MQVRPITIRAANAFVHSHHRHNKPTQGGRFAIAAIDANRVIGVAIVGRTIARRLHDDCTAEVTRLCTVADAPKNTCSFLYGACRRIWQSMGGTRLITYTLKVESGASLRAAGYTPTVETGGKQWSVPSRRRKSQPVFEQLKIRWEAL